MLVERKPDLETESFKAWVADNKEKDGVEKDDVIKIKYKDTEFGICGFNKVIDKKTNNFIFAYKFRDDKNLILYYIPEGNTEEDLKNIKEFFEFIDKANIMFGYKRQDVMDTLKSVYEQKNSLFKLGEKKHEDL